MPATIADLQALCRQVVLSQRLYSQAEEDAVLDVLVRAFGIEHGTFVEIGVGFGGENNTRRLAEHGWSGVWLGDEAIVVKPPSVHAIQTTVTPDNVIELLGGITARVDVFSLDIDGNDYWVGQVAIDFLTPTIVVVEYNQTYDGADMIMPYTPNYRWHRGMPCGCSLKAWIALLSDRYDLIYTTRAAVNAFFIRRSAAVLSSPAGGG